ncbi:hypothetical protein E4U45_007386 [Claviceps purpurea]|nr:hypothetical protein E4U45_007386 [Claviceps purpurea]
MTTLETNIINKLDTFMAIMTARSTEVDERREVCQVRQEDRRSEKKRHGEARQQNVGIVRSSVATLRG